MQEVNRELQESLVVGAEDASVALSDAPRKQRALLARIEARVAEVQREVGALGLDERDKSLVGLRVSGVERGQMGPSQLQRMHPPSGA